MRSFNRTTVELKLRCEVATSQDVYPFNRTTVELKLEQNQWATGCRKLLIEPLWN